MGLLSASPAAGAYFYVYRYSDREVGPLSIVAVWESLPL